MLYAGIGSSQTPLNVLAAMKNIAIQLAPDWTLRSGGAEGADTAFEQGAKQGNGDMQIFLPWNNFNGHKQDDYHHVAPENHTEAIAIAKAHHPYWNNLSDGAKKLHSRNVYQILGGRLDEPVSMVICWTLDGKSGGGTGQALRIARKYGVPIFDLAFNETLEILGEFVNARC